MNQNTIGFCGIIINVQTIAATYICLILFVELEDNSMDGRSCFLVSRIRIKPKELLFVDNLEHSKANVAKMYNNDTNKKIRKQ